MPRIKQMRMFPFLVIAILALVLSPVVVADRDEEIPFDEVKLFFEFNSTDNDLGVQLLLDGEAWDRLKISDPRGREILDIKASGSLGRLGLTELFFESAEPSPAEVLALFRAGTYEFEGRTVEGDELEGEAVLSHQFPAAPFLIEPSDGQEDVDEPVEIDWAAGSGGAVPDVSYQVILEREDLGIEVLLVNILDASQTELTIPDELTEPDTEYKYEVLAVAANGNKTIAEASFTTAP